MVSLLVLTAIAVSLGVTLSNNKDSYTPRLKVPNQIAKFQFIPKHSYNYKVTL